MKIFLINLDSRPDRLKKMENQLSLLELSFERVSAVVGKDVKNISDYFSTERFLLENHHPIVPGEVGCSLSHINIWKEIIEKNLSHAIILEDDVIISNKLLDLINSNIYTTFDYLKIDFPFDKEKFKSQNYSRSRKAKYVHEDGFTYNIFCHHSDNIFNAYECDPVPYYTGGYIISKYGAERFLTATKKMYYPIDLLPRYVTGNTRQGFLSTEIVKHLAEDTDISGRNFNKKISLQNKFKQLFYKIFSSRRLRQLELFFR